jgi:hypothetical protein
MEHGEKQKEFKMVKFRFEDLSREEFPPCPMLHAPCELLGGKRV